MTLPLPDEMMGNTPPGGVSGFSPMPSFTYTAIDPTGKKVSGSVVVRNKAEVYRELEAKSLTPVVVDQASEAAPAKPGREARPTPANPAQRRLRSRRSAARA